MHQHSLYVLLQAWRMWAAVLVALVASAAAETLTETAPGANGQPATYTVTSDAYLNTAAAAGIETAYTLSTGASDTTFTFLVSWPALYPAESIAMLPQMYVI